MPRDSAGLLLQNGESEPTEDDVDPEIKGDIYDITEVLITEAQGADGSSTTRRLLQTNIKDMLTTDGSERALKCLAQIDQLFRDRQMKMF